MRSLLIMMMSACVVAIASRADAQTTPDPEATTTALRQPLPEAQRPITLPKLVLAPQAGFSVDKQGKQGAFGDLDLLVRFGITNDLTVHLLVAPLELWSPGGGGGVQYGQSTENRGPAVGLMYRFVRGDVEIAGSLLAHVFTVKGLSGGSIIPSLPIRFHASENVRLDVVPTVNIFIAKQTTTPVISFGTVGSAPAAPPSTETSANAVRISVPVSALYNATPAFDLRVNSGLTIYDVNNAQKTTGIPLGFGLGYAIAGALGPIADIDPFFNFPYLIMPSQPSGTNAAQYVIGVNLTGYLYL